jgi:hypothetical protein
VIEAGLRGAFLLARGRPEGMLLFEATPAGALRSFWAAAICLPGFLVLRLVNWAGSGAPASGVGVGLAAELIGYVFAWAGFALASLPIAEQHGRKADWPRFIAAWNWANVVQYLVLLALTVPAGFGLPGVLSGGLGLAALGYALWLEWFVARHALRLAAGPAALVVGLDVFVSIFVSGLVERIGG